MDNDNIILFDKKVNDVLTLVDNLRKQLEEEKINNVCVLYKSKVDGIHGGYINLTAGDILEISSNLQVRAIKELTS